MARIEARFPAEIAAQAPAWRRLRAEQYLRMASGAPELAWHARLRWILRAIAARPVQGAAYRALARLAGRRG
jgi:hypothetical protein